MFDKVPPSINGHQIFIGGAGSDFKPGWFTAFKHKLSFLFAVHWRSIALFGLPALALTVGALLFLFWPNTQQQPATTEKTANNPGGAQQTPTAQPTETDQTKTDQAKDEKKTSSKKSTNSSSGGSSGSSGGSGGSSGGGSSPTSKNCVSNPSSCGYPDDDNAGVPAGTSLTVLNLPAGYMDVTVAGTVIEKKDVRGCLIIKAPNVTIRKSKVSCDNYSVIYNSTDYYSAGGLLVEDTDITCNNTNGTGMSHYGFTARRVNIYNCENAFSIDYDVTIEDSYLHNFYEGPSGHADGIQMGGTPNNIVINHNTIFSVAATAAVNWTGQTQDVVIEDNFMGGGSYVVYCPRVTIPTGAYKVLNNRFADSLSAYGFSDDCAGGDVTWTGNYKDSDLSPVPAT